MLTSTAVVGRCNPDTIIIQNSLGYSIPAKITAYNDKYGLASLSINKKVDNYASIGIASGGSFSDMGEAQSLFSAAYKEDDKSELVKSIAWGTVEQFTPNSMNRTKVDISVNALSGGGVVLGMEATLVGLISKGSSSVALKEPVQEITSIVDAKTIKQFAEENGLEIIYWKDSSIKKPPAVLMHADIITGLVLCKPKLSFKTAFKTLLPSS